MAGLYWEGSSAPKTGFLWAWLLSHIDMVWCLSSVLSPLGAGTLMDVGKKRNCTCSCICPSPHSYLLYALPTVTQNPTYQIILLYFYTVQGEDPYYTENGGGQGYSSGPGASPETQGKANVTRGAQENGTGQATSRNGHSARQHVVADTEL